MDKIADCLEQPPSTKTCYCLFPCDILKLNKASNDAYLILGELNKQQGHIAVKENNKKIAHGPIIHYILSNDNKSAGKQNQILWQVCYTFHQLDDIFSL